MGIFNARAFLRIRQRQPKALMQSIRAFGCEEAHKRCVGVGKNAKKVRELFQNFAKYELRIYRYFEIFIISIVNQN